MVCLEQRNPDAEHEQQQHRCDHLSSPATAAGWRGGEGCSHPAAHQIGRSTISNSAGNSWDIFINVLKVFRRSVMQCCQWIAPPSRARLDCRHCTNRFKIWSLCDVSCYIAFECLFDKHMAHLHYSFKFGHEMNITYIFDHQMTPLARVAKLATWWHHSH